MCPSSIDRSSLLRTQNSLHQLEPTPVIRRRRSSQSTTRKQVSPISENEGSGTGILRVRTLEESLHGCPSIASEDSGGSYSSSEMKSSSFISKVDRSRPGRRTVVFSEIMIREYNVTIGDNPSCSKGAPFSLDWTYNPDTTVSSLDLYEKFRSLNPCRGRSEMILPMSHRHEKLKHEWNVSTSEIVNCIREIKAIQEYRFKSAREGDRRIRAEAMLENAKSSVRRLGFQKK